MGWGLSGCASTPSPTIGAAPVHVSAEPAKPLAPSTGLAGTQARYLEAQAAFREAAAAVERAASRYDKKVTRAGRSSRSAADLANVDPASITSRAEAEALKSRALALEGDLRSYQRSERNYRRAVKRYEAAEEELQRARTAYQEAVRGAATLGPSESPAGPEL